MREHRLYVLEICARLDNQAVLYGYYQLITYEQLRVVYEQVQGKGYGAFETIFDGDDAFVRQSRIHGSGHSGNRCKG